MKSLEFLRPQELSVDGHDDGAQGHQDLAHPVRSRPQALADLMRVLHRLCPGAQVVAMSSRFEAKQEALAAGASGFISKTDLPDEVLSSIVGFFRNHS